MLQSIFLWYYCLSIPDAILLTAIFSAGFLILRGFLQKKRFWRPVIILFFLAWLGVIAAATLTDRTPETVPLVPQLTPFHSYRAVLAGENQELLRSNFMNVMLFYPAGLLGCEALSKRRNWARRVLLVTILFALFSVGVELCQYVFALGQTEVDDVIHNTLGALLGALVCAIQLPGKARS